MADSHLVNVDTRHQPDWSRRGRLQHGKSEWIVANSKRPAAYSVIQKAIGKRIKWARLLVEPNRAAFCRDLRVDRSTLQKIEDGDRSPTVFMILELSHRLGVSPNYILWGSLSGVDGELAARLLEAYPELSDHNRHRTAMGVGIDPPPRKQAQK
jgi:transcriptional regulator with XRE-family HTH domain